MYRVKLILSFVTVAAFLVAVGVGGADAGALAGKKLMLDTVINGGEKNDGVNMITPSMAMAGDTVNVELFVEDGGGNSTNALEAVFGARAGEMMLDEGWAIIALSKETYTLQLKVGPDVVQVGALPAADIPDNGYIGTVSIVAAADAVPGVSFYVKSAVIGLGDGSLDSLDVSGAVVTVVPPPPVLIASGDMLMEGNMIDIPHGESASVNVSVEGAMSDSPSVMWSVDADTVGTGTVTLLDADGNELMLDDMMMAAGPTSVTVQVSGGSRTVTVKANVDGRYTEPMTFTFTQLAPTGPSIVVDPMMGGNMFQIPADGNVQVTLSLENLPDTASISWAITDRQGDGSLVVLDTDGNMLEPDDMMMVSADAIVLKVSGGTLRVTGHAIVNGEETESITLTFTQLNPAELASFDGAMQEDRVVLNWSTVSQTNNAGWQITRSVDGETFEAVGEFVQGAGTSDALMNYTFEDKNLPGVEKVFYRLEQVDLDGSVSQSNVIEVLLGARMPLPTEFAVNVYPNPFNPSTTISYELPEGAPVSVVIYDVLGQQVRHLISQFNSAGRYSVQWDARDNQGRGVASGVYIAKVDAGTATLSQKMLLLK